MYDESLDVATWFVVVTCLWVRRATWQHRWERAKTIGLALIAVGTILKVRPVSTMIDQCLPQGTHLLVAYVLIVSGIASFAYSAETKIRSDVEIPKWRLRCVVIPGSVGTATMLALFVGGHPIACWLAYQILTVYFLTLWTYALACLFYDPPSRWGAGVFLFAVGLSLVSAVCRCLLIAVEGQVPDATMTSISETAKDLAITLLAVSSAYMWTRAHKGLLHNPSGSNVSKITQG